MGRSQHIASVSYRVSRINWRERAVSTTASRKEINMSGGKDRATIQADIQHCRDIEIMAFYFLIEQRFELRHQSKALRCFIPS
jgi:hypothetical protein